MPTYDTPDNFKKIPDAEQIEWTFHAEYFAIAVRNYGQAKPLEAECELLRKKREENKGASESEQQELVNLEASKNEDIAEHVMIVVVFCALSVEAYINHYAIKRLSKNYFENYLDKLDLKAKWIIIPRITTGKQLDTGSEAMEDLGWLISARNKLVHYKSKKIRADEITDSDFWWESDAARAITAVKQLLTELKAIDGTVETEFLDGRRI